MAMTKGELLEKLAKLLQLLDRDEDAAVTGIFSDETNDLRDELQAELDREDA